MVVPHPFVGMIQSALLMVITAFAAFLCGCRIERLADDACVRPNVVLIVADDLGYGELGCYGQPIIRTPHLDEMAARGVRFTHAYAGSCVCAPSRCCLLTGMHTGHSAIRDNKELSPEGQEPLPADAVTIAEVLRASGYRTAAIGKWGLGQVGSSGDPLRQGFEHFFGAMCQRHAHNHCPTYLYRDGVREPLNGNPERPANGLVNNQAYAPDLYREEAVRFIDHHTHEQFFLYVATPVPHAALQAPEDSLAEYRSAIPDSPYDGAQGYLAHPTPRAAYAAMVTRMDRDVGAILQALSRNGIAEHTIVMFTSDNGPTFNGGTDSTFFNSTGGLRGRKCSLHEGGIRVPLIICWPGRIAPSVPACAVASWDLMPTIASLCGVSDVLPQGDGIDLSALLLRSETPDSRPPLYWEYPLADGWQAVRIGNYKGLRRGGKSAEDSPLAVFDLSIDPTESTDISREHPNVVAAMMNIIRAREQPTINAWQFRTATSP